MPARLTEARRLRAVAPLIAQTRLGGFQTDPLPQPHLHCVYRRSSAPPPDKIPPPSRVNRDADRMRSAPRVCMSYVAQPIEV